MWAPGLLATCAPWCSFEWSQGLWAAAVSTLSPPAPLVFLHRCWGGTSTLFPPALGCVRMCPGVMGTVSAVTLLVRNGAAVSGGGGELRACWACVKAGSSRRGRFPAGGWALAVSLLGMEKPPASLAQGWPWACICTPPGPGIPEPRFLRFGLHGLHPLKAQPPLCPRLWGGLSVPGGPAGASCLNPWAAWQ